MHNKFPKISALILTAVLLLSFVSCGTKPGNENTQSVTEPAERENKTKVAVMNGATAVGLAKLKADRSYAFEIETYSDLQETASLISDGRADIAVLPPKLAAKLYKESNGKIQMLAISAFGSFSVISKDASVKSISDLGGKTVYTSGKGTACEDILNGLPEKIGDIQYVATPGELVSLAVDGKADTVILPEPFATNITEKNKEMKKVCKLSTEWEKLCESELAAECIVARKDYIESNPEIISAFIEYAEISVNFVNNTAYSSLELVKQGYYDSYDEADISVPVSGIVFITGDKAKEIIEDNFSVLYGEDSGKAVPDEGFYFGRNK